MSKRAFGKIMQGIEEARAYLEGTADKSRYRVHVPEEVHPRHASSTSAPRSAAAACSGATVLM